MSRPVLVVALLCATAASAINLPSQERAEADAAAAVEAAAAKPRVDGAA